MTDVLRGLRLRLQMSKWLWLFRDTKWLNAVATVHAYIDKHIDRTFEEMQREEALQMEKLAATEDEQERSDLLWYMAHNLKHDRAALRSQVLLLFVPNNDTTSIFISHVFWNLARRPDVWAKVHAEVSAHGDAPLTFESLRAMKYLNSVLNESK